MQSLQDKVAIITGASYGLGKAIAFKLAPEGAKLALIARTETELKKLTDEIKHLGVNCSYYLCDIRDAKQIKTTVEKILKDYGTIDILVNNAGIYFEDPTIKLSVEHITALFATNTVGTVFMTKSVLPTLLKNNSGQIFNVISISGVEPSGEWSVYASTKHAIEGYTESLRKELRQTKIKVMAIYPEGMSTNIFRKAGLKFSSHESWMMDPDDVANIVVFMLKQPDDVVMGRVEIRKIES